jgi:hypothetical protein
MAVMQQYARHPGNHQYGLSGYDTFQRAFLDPDVDRQARAAELPHQLGQQRFNQIFPMLQNQLGQAMAGATSPGGSSGQSPEITVGPMWNPQQVQQQVNASRAANDQATGVRMQQAQRRVGASGFGSNSPLAMALQGNLQNQNLATNTANERELRLGAAQKNSDQVFRTQMGREQQFAARQGEDIERRKPYFNQFNSLLSAIAGMV